MFINDTAVENENQQIHTAVGSENIILFRFVGSHGKPTATSTG